METLIFLVNWAGPWWRFCRAGFADLPAKVESESPKTGASLLILDLDDIIVHSLIPNTLQMKIYAVDDASRTTRSKAHCISSTVLSLTGILA